MGRSALARYRPKIWSGHEGRAFEFDYDDDADVPRYIGKFYSMRTQLQAISLRIQVKSLAPG